MVYDLGEIAKKDAGWEHVDRKRMNRRVGEVGPADVRKIALSSGRPADFAQAVEV